MAFDQQVILWCLAAPAILAGAAMGWAAGLTNQPTPNQPTMDRCVGADQSSRRAAAIVAVLWAAAVLLPLAGQQWLPAAAEADPWQSALWAQIVDGESWQQTIWPTLAMAVWFGLTSAATRIDRGLYWIGVLLISLGTAYLAMPTGDGWVDLYPLQRSWIPLLAASVCVNLWSLQRITDRGGMAWSPLVLLAALGVPLLLAAINYAAIAQWAVAAVAATIAVTTIGWLAALKRRGADRGGVLRTANAMAAPGVVLIAVVVTSVRFYTWEKYPAWIYAIGLFLPAAVMSLDTAVASRSASIRVPLAATAAAAMIAACGWRLFLAAPLNAD